MRDTTPEEQEMTPTLEQRFELKIAIADIRTEIEATRKSADYPYSRVCMFDLEAVLEEIDRLMLVNGQIAKLWADAEDRGAAPNSEGDDNDTKA